MPNTDCELISELRSVLTHSQRYSPVVAGNYCAYARGFLDYLARRSIPIAEVTEAQVGYYLHHAITMFRKRRGRPPGPCWHSIPRSGIHALRCGLHGAVDHPLTTPCCRHAALYVRTTNTRSGCARSEALERSIYALMWEGRSFLTWQQMMRRRQPGGNERRRHRPLHGYARPHQTRKSVKDAWRASSLAVALSAPYAPHRNRLVAAASSTAIVCRRRCPRSWSAIRSPPFTDASKDAPVGLRDQAILQLLATYGLVRRNAQSEGRGY